jgi:hypothetical protein
METKETINVKLEYGLTGSCVAELDEFAMEGMEVRKFTFIGC